jgi:hypothetical protein
MLNTHFLFAVVDFGPEPNIFIAIELAWQIVAINEGFEPYYRISNERPYEGPLSA